MAKFPKELITVTPLSITLSVICFIFFMFLAFYLGTQYQRLQVLEEQQLKNAKTPIVALNPSDTIYSPTPTSAPYSASRSSTFTNTPFYYSVQYPPKYKAEMTQYSVIFDYTPDPEALGAPGFPSFYVTVLDGKNNEDPEAYNRLTKEQVTQIALLKNGEEIDTNPHTADSGNWIFTRIQGYTVDGLPGVTIENAKPFGYGGKDLRILVKKNGLTYMIGTYYATSQQLQIFKSFLSTFRFTK